MANQQINSFLAKQVDSRSTEFGGRIRTTARTLHTIAEHLRADANTHGTADLADRGANMIDRVGAYLEESDCDTFVSDAEDFSRERPWMVASVGLAAGVVAARVLKATASRRQALAESDFAATGSGQGVSRGGNGAATNDGAKFAPRERELAERGSGGEL